MSERRVQLVQDLAARFAAESIPVLAANELELRLPIQRLEAATAEVLDAPGQLIGAYATRDAQGVIVRYLIELDQQDLFVVMRTDLSGQAPELPSLAALHPALAMAELEMAERFGVALAGHPAESVLSMRHRPDAPLPCRVEGDGVAHFPLGPLRGPLAESFRLRLSTFGDRIVHAEIDAAYKHRGAEQRVEGLAPASAILVAERVCGTCTLANATALAVALERLAGVAVPRRAVWLRTALLEMERISAHGLTLGLLCAALTWPAGEARALAARERFLTACEALFGARRLHGVIAAGGLRRDLSDPGRLLAAVQRAVADLRAVALDALDDHAVAGQLANLGVVTTEVARDFALSGPAARAAGIRRDARIDHPHLAYDEAVPWIPVYLTGDGAARLRVLSDELEQSAAVIEEVLAHLPQGVVRKPLDRLVPGARALGFVESASGLTLHAVHTDSEGRIERWALRTAALAGLAVLPLTMAGARLADLPRIEHSMFVCMGCADR